MRGSTVCGAAMAIFALSGSGIGAVPPTYLSIDPMGMIPDSPASSSSYKTDWSGSLTNDGFGVRSCFNTGVILPQSSSVTDLILTFQSAAASNPSITFVRHNTATGVSETIVSRSLLEDGGARVTKTLFIPTTLRVVRNDLYSYGLGICLGRGDWFFGAKILYQ